jgi:hypothetical protein
MKEDLAAAFAAEGVTRGLEGIERHGLGAGPTGRCGGIDMDGQSLERAGEQKNAERCPRCGA